MIDIQVLAWIPLSPTEALRVSFEQHEGQPVAQVRVHRRDERGAWDSTPRGLCLDVDTWRQVLPVLRRALAEDGGRSRRNAILTSTVLQHRAAGLPIRRIAALLGISKSRVSRLLARAWDRHIPPSR